MRRSKQFEKARGGQVRQGSSKFGPPGMVHMASSLSAGTKAGSNQHLSMLMEPSAADGSAGTWNGYDLAAPRHARAIM